MLSRSWTGYCCWCIRSVKGRVSEQEQSQGRLQPQESYSGQANKIDVEWRLKKEGRKSIAEGTSDDEDKRKYKVAERGCAGRGLVRGYEASKAALGKPGRWWLARESRGGPGSSESSRICRRTSAQ